MSYSGSNGEYHAFPNITDVRTVFWAVRRQTNKYSFFLGHTGSYHFHTDGGNKFWSNQYAHQNVKNGDLWVNGSVTDGLSNNSVPTAFSIVSL